MFTPSHPLDTLNLVSSMLAAMEVARIIQSTGVSDRIISALLLQVQSAHSSVTSDGIIHNMYLTHGTMSRYKHSQTTTSCNTMNILPRMGRSNTHASTI